MPSSPSVQPWRRNVGSPLSSFVDHPQCRFGPGPRPAWISDETTERWGAVYLFESAEAARQPLPSRARELIGKDPDIAEEFEVEATIEGRYASEALSRLGLAFE